VKKIDELEKKIAEQMTSGPLETPELKAPIYSRSSLNSKLNGYH